MGSKPGDGMSINLKRYTTYQNAGDVASGVVVAHVSGETPNIVGLEWRAGPNLLAIGSILEWADEQSVVWGSGFIIAGSRLLAAPRAILAVRGELTRAGLIGQGISCDPVLGDPGIFISEIYPRGTIQWSVGVVPHYVDLDTPFVERARAAGLRVINPLLPFETFISELAACDRVISSSLHGLIFAHAYGIPAIWVELSDRVMGDGFKFRDYYSSVGVRGDDVPRCNAESPLVQLIERCHLPPERIDKASLRNALRAGLYDLQT